MAAALALGSGATLALTHAGAFGAAKAETVAKAEAPAGEVKLIADGNATYSTDYPLNGNQHASVCESLYPASLLDEAIGYDNYTITEAILTLDTHYGVAKGSTQIQLYMATTGLESLTLADKLSEGDMTLVADYTLDYSALNIDAATETAEVAIPLDTPFAVNSGESIVIGFKGQPIVTGSGYTCWKRHYFEDNSQPFSIYNTNSTSFDELKSQQAFVPSLKLRVVEGELGSEGGNNNGGGAADVVVASSTYETWCYPIAVTSSGDPSASQSIYPYGLLDEKIGLDTYTITEVMYPFTQKPTYGKVRLSMFMAANNQTSLETALSASDMTLVADLEIDFSTVSDNALTIPLTTPFVMHKGESLVAGVLSEVVDYMTPSPQPKFQECSLSSMGYYGELTKYYPWGASSFEECGWGEQNVPGMILHVVEGEGVGGGTVSSEANIVTGDEGNWNVGVIANSYYTDRVSQQIYPYNLLEEKIAADEYAISELLFPLTNTPSKGKIAITAYLATSSDNSLYSALSASAFTICASNYEVDLSTIKDNIIRIPLSEKFAMTKGQSLVIGLYTHVIEAPDSDVICEYNDISGSEYGYGRHTYYSSQNSTEIYTPGMWAEDGVAGLSLVYETAGTAVATDLSVSSLTAPEGKLYTGKTYDFNVRVRNNGTDDVENYTIELFDTNTNNVIATEEVAAALNAGLSATITISHEFTAAGNFNLAARVIAEGDEDASNNVSETVAVEVEALAYKATAINGNTTAVTGNNETYTVTVANEGNGLLEDYQVSLVLVREGLPDKVVAIETEVPAIEAGKTADVAFDYTFDLSGTYGLKGIVVKDEGEPSETSVLNVTISLDKLSPVIQNQFPKWDGATTSFGAPAMQRDYANSASQVLYPASYFGDHENNYQIQQIGFTVCNEEYQTSPTAVKIYLAQTDRTEGFEVNNVSSLIPEEEFTLVYDGVFTTQKSMDPQTVVLDLQQLFTLENGKGLAMNIVTSKLGDSYFLYLASTTVTENNVVAYNYSAGMSEPSQAVDNFSIYDKVRGVSNQLPCLTLGYALEPLPAKVDMAVTDFSMTTTDEIIINETEAAFRLNFENLGTVDCAEEDYTIELLNVNDKDNPEVLATFDGTRYVAPGGTTFQTLRYVFTRTGQFNVAARIVVADDVDLDNNTSESVLVTVGEPSGVASVLADGTFEFDAATSVLYVNLGKCVVNVADLTGRVIAYYALDGAAEINLDLTDGVYVISANGKTLKIRK